MLPGQQGTSIDNYNYNRTWNAVNHSLGFNHHNLQGVER